MQGLRPTNNSNAANFERQFSELRKNLDANAQTDFRFIVEGSPKPLCAAIADEVFHFCREALVN